MYCSPCRASAKMGDDVSRFLSLSKRQAQQRSVRTRKAGSYSFRRLAELQLERRQVRSGSRRCTILKKTAAPFGLSGAEACGLSRSSCYLLPVFSVGACVPGMTLHCRRKSNWTTSLFPRHSGVALRRWLICTRFVLTDSE